MNEKRRRWFAFRLRTLFAAVLVMSLPLAWVAHEWQAVHERQSVANWIDQRNRAVGFTEIPGINSVEWPATYSIRHLFGDRMAFWVYVKPAISEEERLRIVRAFPEAKQFLHVE